MSYCNLGRQLVARTIVIGGMSYLFLDNIIHTGARIHPDSLGGHFAVGLVGAVGSSISQAYLEPSSMWVCA